MHWGEKYYDLVCSLCWLPHQQLDVASLGKHKFPGNSSAPTSGCTRSYLTCCVFWICWLYPNTDLKIWWHIHSPLLRCTWQTRVCLPWFEALPLNKLKITMVKMRRQNNNRYITGCSPFPIEMENILTMEVFFETHFNNDLQVFSPIDNFKVLREVGMRWKFYQVGARLLLSISMFATSLSSKFCWGRWYMVQACLRYWYIQNYMRKKKMKMGMGGGLSSQ